MHLISQFQPFIKMRTLVCPASLTPNLIPNPNPFLIMEHSRSHETVSYFVTFLLSLFHWNLAISHRILHFLDNVDKDAASGSAPNIVGVLDMVRFQRKAVSIIIIFEILKPQ